MVMLDLYENETLYHEALKSCVDVLYEAYEHTYGAPEQARLAQELANLIGQRPLLDLSHVYFKERWGVCLSCMYVCACIVSVWI